MPFHHFRHEAVQRAAASRHELQHTGTLILFVEGSLDGFYLSPDPANPTQEFCFVLCRVSHIFRP
jgi:hypothetical protein